MSYDIKKGTVVSHVETDPYIPLNIYFGEVDFDVDRMVFTARGVNCSRSPLRSIHVRSRS